MVYARQQENWSLLSYINGMRKELAKEEGKRKKFKAVFVRLGKKMNFKGYTEETILLKNVVDLESNKVVADHVWFGYTKGFLQITPTEGVVLEFEARVKEYTKGYVNKGYQIDHSKTDFKLSHPTKIRKIAAQ